MKYEILTYEEEMARIEQITGLLSTNLRLDESIELYEKATERLQHCRNLLAEAELKVVRIASSFSEGQQ